MSSAKYELIRPYNNWYTQNRPKRDKKPKYSFEISAKLKYIAFKKGWGTSFQYFCGGYQCIGLYCHKNHKNLNFTAEWHVAIEDVLEDITYCPWCGPPGDYNNNLIEMKEIYEKDKNL